MKFKKRINGSWTDIPHYIHNTDTDTITTLPTAIYPNDTTATVGLKGNMEQSSQPSHDNPIMPQGTGERTRNLYNINANDVNNGYVNNAQLNQDGTTEKWGSAEISEYIPINGDTAYTFNGIGSYNTPCYGLYDENKQLIGAYRYNGARIINFTSPNNARYFRFTHIKNFTYAMMVEGAYISSTMPEFEPYGYKIPISSAGQTTPVYLGEVQATRRVKKLVLTGDENWSEMAAGLYRITVNGYLRIIDIQVGMSSHFGSGYTVGAAPSAKRNELAFLVSNSGNNYVYFSPSQYLTLSDFKTYLAQQYAAGTPVTVWYVLATETTGILNEPLMKIGDYADEVSGISIPTIAGANTISVDTTLQPSEVTVNYKGWHPIQNVHEAENGQWD